jgi:hypothetical protein
MDIAKRHSSTLSRQENRPIRIWENIHVFKLHLYSWQNLKMWLQTSLLLMQRNKKEMWTSCVHNILRHNTSEVHPSSNYTKCKLTGWLYLPRELDFRWKVWKLRTCEDQMWLFFFSKHEKDDTCQLKQECHPTNPKNCDVLPLIRWLTFL